MTLKYEPEPIEKLKERFPKIFNRIWTKEDVESNEIPSTKREHVFDFESGLRMIISQDDFDFMPYPFIHISASWHGEFNGDYIQFFEEIYTNAQKLGIDGEIVLLGISPGGIPHYCVINLELINNAKYRQEEMKKK